MAENESLEGFDPDWVSPPGASLIEYLQDCGVSMEVFAQRLGFTEEEADDLIRARTQITEDIADKIAEITGRATGQFWLNREVNYRKHLARLMVPRENAPCPLCRHPFSKLHHDMDTLWCSEFCAVLPEGDRAAWLTFDPGDWGFYPCKECGGVIEDDFYHERICGSCGPKVRFRSRTELLKKVLADVDIPPELRDEIETELKR